VQGRVVEVVLGLGRFFAALKLDDLRGVTDDAETVTVRSAQLRCAFNRPFFQVQPRYSVEAAILEEHML
jgi:hypothetical protein